MYEQFFDMAHTPFSRDVPPEALYESASMHDALGRLSYVADRQLFAVVTADAGCGKSTLARHINALLLPTGGTVWVGGMDGEYVECSRVGDEVCPVRCRTFTLEGETNSEGCAACSPASACEGVDEWLGKAATGNVSGDTMTVLDDSGKTIGTLPRSGS